MRGPALATLRAQWRSTRDSAALRAQLEGDPRAGAQVLLAEVARDEARAAAEARRLDTLLEHERHLESRGYRAVAGVDEAGVGPLAGPVVAAAVILPSGWTLPGLDDSKKITNKNKRLELAARIKAEARAWAVAEATVEEIDRLNIYHAGLLAMCRAVDALTLEPDFCLVDARTLPHRTMPQQGLVGGDGLSLSIAAASVLAKTSRDAQMEVLDARFPGYGLAGHAGYPTPSHVEALMRLGPSPIHRQSFAPVQAARAHVAR